MTLQRQVWRTVANPNVILWNGQVAGIWKTRMAHNRLTVTLIPFVPLPDGAKQKLLCRAQAYAEFRNLPLEHCVAEEQ